MVLGQRCVVVHPARWLSWCVVACGALLISSCTQEETTPIDLDRTTIVGEQDVDPANDPNAEARTQVIQLAEEQCRNDPSLEFGVIVFADPATGEEVNRYEHPCDEVD